jgi:4,5-DOPA dioxygenase extradiol
MSAPVLYLPHGGGPLPVLEDPAHHGLIRFLRQLGSSFAVPDALLLVSAHWEAAVPGINAAQAPPLMFDYSGFPPESYRLSYPAPGAPALAAEVAALLQAGGFASEQLTDRGWDHGVFVPLLLLYPEAQVPVLQLSLVSGLDPALHIRLGRCLASLRERNIAIVGSGMSFHNLRALFAGEDPRLRAASDSFDAWLAETMTDTTLSEPERTERLAHWERAPAARFCHPREEHLLPLQVCYGAAGGPASLLFNEPLMGHRVSGFGWY